MIETIFVLWCLTCEPQIAVGRFYQEQTCIVAAKKLRYQGSLGAAYRCIPTEQKSYIHSIEYCANIASAYDKNKAQETFKNCLVTRNQLSGN